jgi:hypothetical protein
MHLAIPDEFLKRLLNQPDDDGVVVNKRAGTP